MKTRNTVSNKMLYAVIDFINERECCTEQDSYYKLSADACGYSLLKISPQGAKIILGGGLSKSVFYLCLRAYRKGLQAND